MRFDLRAIAIRKRPRRRDVTLRPIFPTKAQADDLAAIYARMLQPWATAADRIAPIYERELARALSHDSAEDLGDEADEIAAEINRLILELTPDLKDWALRTERWHRGKWARAILAGLEVNVETMLGASDMRETIEAFLVRNTSLIRDVNEQARSKIADAVLRGIQERTPTAKVAKVIREATGFARARARRIAAHQSVNLSSALDRERRRQAGISVWRWRHSGKRFPRPEHLERDGNLYSDDSDDWGRKVKGETIMKPPEDLPSTLPNCGCTSQAVLLFGDEVSG